MVRPKSRKSVSRRSSILKAPVLQQPLQHVKANASLHQETSITTKQKRRVSFADKKHVKEFCDSVEQGTLWDNTYEESSSEISGQINLNNQYNQTINNDYQDTNDNRITSEYVNVMNNSLDLTEPINTMGSFKPMCVENISIKNLTSIFCESTDKNKDNNSTLIESNANIDICVDKSTVVYNDTSSLNNKENAELNKTCAEDVSMEITEIPYVKGSRNTEPMICEQFFEEKENIAVSNITNKSNILSPLQNKINKKSDKTQYFCTEQLEFTECVQAITKPTEVQAKLSKMTPLPNNEELTNQKTQIFKDIPMEITYSIPLIDKKNCIDRTIIFNDTSMDNTMVVTSITNEKKIPIHTDISEKESTKTELLNTSMEITNQICSLLHAKSDDATTSSIYDNEDTRLNNDAMEFSIVATNLPAITESNKYTILGPIGLSSENTTIFHNKSMEFTEALHIPKILPNNDIQKLNHVSLNPLMNNEDIMSSKTQIFQDESMAMTAPLHTSKILPDNDIQKLNDMSINSLANNKDLMSSKTQIFLDESMATTAPLHTPNILPNNDIQKLNDLSINSLANNENLMSSKTQIFPDESMAMTAPLHTSNILPNNDITKLKDISINSLTNNDDLMSSKTQIFQDESMAMTAPLHTPNIFPYNDIKKLHDISINSLANNEDLMSSKTQIFPDESMAMTAPLHTPNILSNNDIKKLNHVSLNPLMNNEDIMSSKTQIFQDESMAMTAPLHTSKILPDNDIQKLNDMSINSLANNKDLMSSKTQIFLDESMTMTAPLHTPNILPNNDITKLKDISINSLANNEDLMSSKTQIFQNESMAITTPLHTLNALHNNVIQNLYDVPVNSLINDKEITSLNTRIFQNMSMEITNAITNLPILSNSKKLCESIEEDYVNSNINENKCETITNNKTTSGTANNTEHSCTTNYIEHFENNSTKIKPVNALTSLISSFVYADMIEDDSFVAAINENGLQCMTNNIEQETKCQQNNIKVKSTNDNINVEVENVQYPNKCTAKNKEIEYHYVDNNIQEENIMINKEENNQCNPKLILSKTIKINEDAFEKNINHETMCDISTEIEMIRKNKQLNETKKDIDRNSATFVIKPKKNSAMDTDKSIDDCSGSNQISDRPYIFSPTLLSNSNKNKMPIGENNLTGNLTGNINFHDFYEKENCNNSSSNEDTEHVTSHEKPKESSTLQKGTFSSLVHQLKMYMSSNDCIWDLYLEDIDKQMLVVSFISTSLLIVIFTQNDVNTATCSIKQIDIISRLKNDKNVQLSIAHKLIKEKINVKYVNQLYKYDESVVPLLNHISEDVKLVLDFIFDLKQLDNTNLMEINTERITFIARSKYMNIVLEVTMDVKLFDKIDSSNINILCILGTVRKEDIKELVINIKRDHRFLRRFMSDIKGYIDIIEQADLSHKRSCS